MEIGDRIKKLRKSLKLTQKEFSKRADIPLRTLAGIEINEGLPGAKLLNKIAQTFKVDLNWLLAGEGKHTELPLIIAEPKPEYESAKKLISVPIINEVPAGYPEYPFIDDYIRDHVYLPNIPKHAFGLYVTGKSMEPEINNGDIVIVDPHIREVKKGDLGVFRIDGETTVKRCISIRGGFLLQPTNLQYSPILVTEDTDCIVIGKVIYKIVKC